MSVFEELAALRGLDLPLTGGTTWAYIYDSGSDEIREVGARAYAEMLDVNGLDPTAFPSVVALENSVVGTASALLGGGSGMFTSGGTESCLLAVHAAREARSDVDGPEIVLPVTAHPAFHKAAHYFGLTVVTTPVDTDFRASVDAVEAAITDRTVLVVASAPSYPTGTVDPVPAIAAVAAERGVLCHVDACIGGWVLPFLPSAPPFDLSVPGVTSLSVDLHKYAYAPKGASVLLFRDRALRRRAWFAYAGWPGYPVINPTAQSAKTAGPLAAAWAVLRHVGTDGYRDLALAARDALLRLAAGVSAVDGLRVLGVPDSTLLAVAGDGVDVFVVADELRARGFYAQVQLSLGAVPPTLHFSAHGVSPSTVDALLTALADAVAAARASGPAAAADL
ncbi:MAG TPA: aminotransferase class V-fold PLP-dependent enzyme, partial [Mycobacteriales bacterium]|nr:aminotransferase class V-fold PLP-dependent enzyme [Mycobacteriales bacterium]